ncbi:MAG: undecaprenyldiphospho-muramoylpentapeptide beta-N-acetylglucosaminyltransferase [Clostridia bacterium]
MRVVFACAGTGGHINPAIAIANIIKKKEKSDILFLGRENGLENELVSKAGFEIKHIRTGKILRSFTFKNVHALFNAYKGVKDSKKILLEFKPDIVIGTGGYICIPVMFACQKLHIPYILHESNAIAGVSIKVLAKKAAKVLLGFENTKIKSKNTKYTGTPTKFDETTMNNLNKNKCRQLFNIDINKKVVLVTCGSQGARNINNTILDMLRSHLSNKFFIVLIAGSANYEDVLGLKEQVERENNINLDEYIKIIKFVYEMQNIYKIADMCITRAGAMTICELAIAHLPAILIPLPNAAENHQFYNAKILENANVAKIIEEKDLNSQMLYNQILNMLDEKNLEKMKKRSLDIDTKQIEEKIYTQICNIVKK